MVPNHVDLQDGYIIQVMGLVDTGSNVSFLSQDVLERMAPHLLKWMTPFCRRVQGISGEAVIVGGKVIIPGQITEKCLSMSL